jgi:hypothetical protein
MASKWGNLEAVKYLCDLGAAVNVGILLAACDVVGGQRHDLLCSYIAHQLVQTKQHEFVLPRQTPIRIASRAFAAMSSALKAEARAHAAYKAAEAQRMQVARDLMVEASCAMQRVMACSSALAE